MILTAAKYSTRLFFSLAYKRKKSHPDSLPWTENDSNSIRSLSHISLFSMYSRTRIVSRYVFPSASNKFNSSMILTIFRDHPISLTFFSRRESRSNQKTIWLVKFRNNSIRDSIFSREYLCISLISSLITISLSVKIISTSFTRKKKLVQNHVMRIYA